MGAKNVQHSPFICKWKNFRHQNWIQFSHPLLSFHKSTPPYHPFKLSFVSNGFFKKGWVNGCVLEKEKSLQKFDVALLRLSLLDSWRSFPAIFLFCLVWFAFVYMYVHLLKSFRYIASLCLLLCAK